jgi:hypothetical protein
VWAPDFVQPETQAVIQPMLGVQQKYV